MTISSDRRAVLRLFAVIALTAGLWPAPADAQSLDALRAEGVVGERYDGIAVVRDPNASSEIRTFVANVNSRRQKIYAERAAQQGVPVSQVARIYAREIYAKLPDSAWFLDESGSWRQK